MSIHYLNTVFHARIGLASRKLLLLALADFANEAGEAYPSIQTLMRKTEQNRKTIRRHVTELMTAGILSDTGERVGRTKQIIKYQIHLERLPILDTLKVSTFGQAKLANFGDLSQPKIPNFGHSKGVQDWATSIEEPSVEERSVEINHQVEPPEIPCDSVRELHTDCQQALENWNDLALRAKLPRCQKITPTRKKKLMHIIREFGIEKFNGAIDLIEKSSFLLGDNDRQWKANFDFIVNESKFVKIIEGVYSKSTPESLAEKSDRINKEIEESNNDNEKD